MGSKDRGRCFGASLWSRSRLGAASSPPSDAPGQTDLRRDASDRIRVDCGAGQTIGRALKHAQPGDSIVVTGTCRERVVITTDRITLAGLGAAVVDGGGGSSNRVRRGHHD